MKSRPLIAAATLLASIALPAQAQLAVCGATANAVAFGNYNTFSTSPLETTGSVTITCVVSLATNFTIKLGSGLGGSYAPRKLQFVGNALNYNLYTNSTRTTVWGDGSGSTQTVSDTYTLAILSGKTYTVYGRLFAQQNAAPGLYTDTVVVTVDY